MRTLAAALSLVALSVVACGGGVVAATHGGDDAGGAPASPADAGSSADAGTSPGCEFDASQIPPAPIYECFPVAPSAQACRGEGDAGSWYPLGCRVVLPQPQGGCVGPCCGGQVCTCQSVPIPPTFDAGAAFVCPI